MNTISLTIPMDHNALVRASDMLQNLAIDIVPGIETLETPDADIDTAGAEIERTIPASEGDTADDNTVSVTTITGVELDSEGLPWDARIHASSKAKLAKTETWKLARGMSNNPLVDTVKTELRAAMAIPAPETTNTSDAPLAPPAPPASETTDTGDAPPAPDAPAEVQTYNVNGVDYTADQLKAAGWSEEQIVTLEIIESDEPLSILSIVTFPELLAKITSNGIDAETVKAACNKSGLATIQLLAARPDLIPAINAELFGS